MAFGGAVASVLDRGVNELQLVYRNGAGKASDHGSGRAGIAPLQRTNVLKNATLGVRSEITDFGLDFRIKLSAHATSPMGWYQLNCTTRVKNPQTA
jgi:hypothetical protein